MTFNLAVRHYWSYAENKTFLSLQQNGRLADYYNINKTPVLILGMLTYHILGGLHQGDFYSIQK
jgi:hypothetical protein